MKEGSRIFSVEYLPGQFDQRADSAVQCVQFIKEDEMPVIKSATTYVIEGAITDEEICRNQSALHQSSRFQRDWYGKAGDIDYTV